MEISIITFKCEPELFRHEFRRLHLLRSTNGESRLLITSHGHCNEIGMILFPGETEQCELLTRVEMYKCVCDGELSRLT